MKKKSLYQQYLSDQHFNQLIKKLGSLAFLQSPEVESTFFSIKEELPSNADNFASYFEATFVRGPLLRIIYRSGKEVYSPPKYSIKEWNVYEEIDRTSNV